MNQIHEKDRVTKEYLEDPLYCADVINGVLYQGKQMIQPTDLQEMSVEEVYGDHHRTRDIFKKIKILKGNEIIYVLVGLEPQSYVDYSMPVRLMEADVTRYLKQIQEITKQTNKNYKRTRMYEKHPLMPIIPIVIWFESEEWKAATKLSEMMYEVPKEIKKYTNEYKYHVLQPSSYSYEELLTWFKCPIGHIMALSKASKDGKMRIEILKNNEMYRHMPRIGARLAKAVIGMEIKEEEESEEVDLMNGWLQDLEDKKIEGRIEGKQEGIDEGLETGKNEGLLEAVKMYMSKTKSSKEEAMEFFEVKGSQREKLLQKLS